MACGCSTKLTLCLFFAISSLIGMPRSSNAQPLPAKIQNILGLLESYPKSITSMQSTSEIHTKLDSSFFAANNIEAGAISNDQAATETWAFKGERSLDRLSVAPGQVWVSIYAGQTSYSIRSENTSAGSATYASKHRGWEGDPGWPPLSFGYKFNGQWLADILKDGGAVIEGTTTLDPADGLLVVVRARQTDDSELRAWLAPKYNYLAVKTEMDSPTKRTVFEARSVRQHGAFWMPAEGQFSLITIRTDGQNVTQVTKSVHFHDLEINNVSDEMFDYRFPTGSGLWDSDKHKKFLRDPFGKWVEQVGFSDGSFQGTAPAQSKVNFAAWGFVACFASTVMLGVARWRRSPRP